jgi:hypothetical protein
VSPTVFQYRKYRFFFFSREEPRVHIHVFTSDGEAKFWIEPDVELAINKGLRSAELKIAEKKIKEKKDEIKKAWEEHFG